MRGIVVCPDPELAEKLAQSLAEERQVTVARDFDRYPGDLELMRCIRAHGPQVLFLSTESLPRAAEIVRLVEREDRIESIQRCASNLLFSIHLKVKLYSFCAKCPL